MKESSHLPSLDGFRAVAVGLVFVAHAGGGRWLPGSFGVTIFFFLSGFLITTLLLRELHTRGKVSIPAFYMRRLLRISPPLLITLAIAYPLAMWGLVDGTPTLGGLSSQVFYYFNYHYLSGVPHTTVPRGTAVLWSLAVEEHFYLVYPVLFFVLIPRGWQNTRIGLISLCLVVILAWRIWLDHAWTIHEEYISYASDTRMDSILYGCLLGVWRWRRDGRPVFPLGRRWMAAITLVCLCVLAGTFLVRDDGFRNTWRYSLQGLALLPLFYYAVTCPTLIHHRLLNTRILRRLGLYSYSFYLIHLFVIRGLQHQFHIDPEQASVGVALASLAISLAYSAVLYTWVEVPVARLRRRFRPSH